MRETNLLVLSFLQKMLVLIFCSTFLFSCTKDFEEQNSVAAVADSQIEVLAQKPNILLIFVDDVGYEVPTVNGGESYSTPNIDQLAETGMRFTQGQSSPMCSPSRFMLLTGKYNFRNYTDWGKLGLDQRTIANMLQDAGYDTYAAGKWQLDGGDNSVRTFGFDEYVLYNLYETIPHYDTDNRTAGRYKNPELFSNGKFLPFGSTIGKYGPDIFADSVKAYMEKSVNRGNPFFIYYSMALCHAPYSPTPDDPEFKNWNNRGSASNPNFFKSMVKYMDKKIGEVIAKVNELGISDKTLVLFMSDNGTPNSIYSVFNGEIIRGGKMGTNKYGVNVPMIASLPGIIPASVNNNVIDLTDFLPTFADVARIPLPTTYGTLDGKSFARQLIQNKNAIPRDWVFCHYCPNNKIYRPLKRFIYNTEYKLYDSTYLFYNIIKDPYEKNSIPSYKMTQEEVEIKQYFISVLDTLH